MIPKPRKSSRTDTCRQSEQDQNKQNMTVDYKAENRTVYKVGGLLPRQFTFSMVSSTAWEWGSETSITVAINGDENDDDRADRGGGLNLEVNGWGLGEGSELVGLFERVVGGRRGEEEWEW